MALSRQHVHYTTSAHLAINLFSLRIEYIVSGGGKTVKCYVMALLASQMFFTDLCGHFNELNV